MKNVIFVCVHNAGRSQMAEAFFNRLAEVRGLDVRAESAGTMGGKELNPMAVQAMREVGVSLEGQTPKLLTQEMVDASERRITMGCGVDAEVCPARFLVTEDWGLDDPAGQPIERVREIRDEIRRRVEALVDELASSPSEPVRCRATVVRPKPTRDLPSATRSKARSESAAPRPRGGRHEPRP